MNSRMAIVLVAIFCVMIGVMIGMSSSGIFNTAPTNHESIAKSISIRDNTFGKQLTPVLVGSGKTIPLSIVQMSFTGEIAWSKWEYRSDSNDPSSALAFAMIWGPGTANEYFCEIGRLSTNDYTLYLPSGTTHWAQGSGEGFSYFVVTR